MALVKNRTFNRLLILSNGVIRGEWIINVEEDGTEIFSRLDRLIFEVTQDVTAQPQILQDVAAAVWTPGIQAARLAEINAGRDVPYADWAAYWLDNPVT